LQVIGGRGGGGRNKEKGRGQFGTMAEVILAAFPISNLPRLVEQGASSRRHETVTPPPGHALTLGRYRHTAISLSFHPAAMPKVVSRAAVSTSQDGPYPLPGEDSSVSDYGLSQPYPHTRLPQTSVFTVRPKLAFANASFDDS